MGLHNIWIRLKKARDAYYKLPRRDRRRIEAGLAHDGDDEALNIARASAVALLKRLNVGPWCNLPEADQDRVLEQLLNGFSKTRTCTRSQRLRMGELNAAEILELEVILAKHLNNTLR